MGLTSGPGDLADGPWAAPLVPIHPESVAHDEQTLRWAIPAGLLDFVGVAAELPGTLRELLDDGTLESLTVESAAVRTRLGTGLSWRDHGALVRVALQRALSTPGLWRPGVESASGDDALRLAVQQVIEGEVGAYIRSHGGRVELLSVHEGEVELRLSGACSHCPASDVTLTDRLEVGIRRLYPGLRRLTAGGDSGLGTGRRMLRLLPTRGR